MRASLIVAVLLFAAAGRADPRVDVVYAYRSADGVTHFASGLRNVPAECRRSAKPQAADPRVEVASARAASPRRDGHDGVVLIRGPSHGQPPARAGGGGWLDDGIVGSRSGERRVLLFSATWCHFCRQLAPELPAVRDGLPANVEMTEYDFDRDAALAARLGVHSVPTFVLMRGDEVVAAHSGAAPAARLLEWIRDRLAR